MTPEQKKGEHGTYETMKVKGEDGGPVVINAHDFDSKVHEKFEEPKAEAKEKAKK